MSDLRIRASEVRARGVEERGNFVPPALPQAIYNYWLSRTNSKKGKAIRYGDRRENFCHFWRVAAFWAPLMAVRNGIAFILPALALLVFLGGIGAAIYALTVTGSWLDLLGFVAGAAAVLYAGVGLFAGIGMGFELRAQKSKLRAQDWEDGGWLYLFAPTSMPAYAAGRGINRFTEFWKDSPKVREWTGKTSLGLAALVVVGLYALMFFVDLGTALLVTGLLVGIVAAMATLMFIGGHISDYVAGKRKIAEEAERAFVATLDDDEYREYHAALREPSNFSKFMRGMGDMVIFAFQVMRVNKWKICPLVDIDTKKAA